MAITIIVVPWIAFVWAATTGLTIATRSSLGRNSSAEHLASTRYAIAATIFAAPLAASCGLARPKE